jgi:hypothetical protein
MYDIYQDDEYFGNEEALTKARNKRKVKVSKVLFHRKDTRALTFENFSKPPLQEEMEGRVESKVAYMLIYRRRHATAVQVFTYSV